MKRSARSAPGARKQRARATNEALPALESVLCTEELDRRLSRSPDYERESRALGMLVQALADSPGTILQALADTMLGVFRVDSAGISLLTEDGERFHWPAIAGQWKPHIGGGTPRDFGPCGDVLDRNCALLFTHFERRYRYLLPMMPPAVECLLAPFYVEGKAVGTLWVIAHDDRRKFDSEDLRMLVTLGSFAAAAYAGEHVDALGRDADEPQGTAQTMREVNEALLVSLVRQHELTEQAQETERKLHEEERVRQQQLDLTNAQRVSTVGELATGLAHELNQPLSSIANLAEACNRHLQAATIDRSRIRGLLSDVVTESLRAAEIVAHLRSFVDKGEAQLKPGDLGEIVSHVPHLLVRELERTQVALRLDLPDRPLRIEADRIQIEQVVVNLIQNALDSIRDADGPRREIELSARAVNELGEVRVRDTGTGVSAATAEQMFDAFFTTKTNGLGIGLTLSRSILEAHRGRIWMESPSDGGPGAVVCFSLPLHEPKRRRKAVDPRKLEDPI